MVMRIVGLVRGGATPFDGLYLKEYDPERDGIDPTGRQMTAHIVCTDDLADAMQFASAAEVHAMWTKVPAREPTRPDGKPNRPLTAFTVEVVPSA